MSLDRLLWCIEKRTEEQSDDDNKGLNNLARLLVDYQTSIRDGVANLLAPEEWDAFVRFFDGDAETQQRYQEAVMKMVLRVLSEYDHRILTEAKF